MSHLADCLSGCPASSDSSFRLRCVNIIGIECPLVDREQAAIFLQASEKATAISFVANAGSNWLDTQQQCIRVAVDTHLEHAEDVSAALAFLPQTLARAAKKNSLASSLRLRERVRVHKAEHQDFAGPAILNNRGHQPTAFFECDFHVLSPRTSNLKTKKPAGLAAPAGR